MKAANPSLKIGFVGAKVAVQPAESLAQGGVIDFVARNEFDFTIKEIAEGRCLGRGRRDILPQQRRSDHS